MAGHIADSSNINWCTPKEILVAVRLLFNGDPDLDPCSNSHSLVNAKLSYSLPKVNGLLEKWNYSTVFVNPPFGKCYINDKLELLLPKQYKDLSKEAKKSYKRQTLFDWTKKCNDVWYYYQNEIVLLIPGAFETKHYQRIIYPNATAILYPEGRVNYVIPGQTGTNSPPMNSALIYWGNKPDLFKQIFEFKGHVEVLRPQKPKEIFIPETFGESYKVL